MSGPEVPGCQQEPVSTRAGLPLALRKVLNEWDPIGVMPLGPPDEYDCMIAPLIRLLDAGATPVELRRFLDAELPSHYGLPPHPRSSAVAERLATLATDDGQGSSTHSARSS